jgi:hypothetical protein
LLVTIVWMRPQTAPPLILAMVAIGVAWAVEVPPVK